MQGSSACGTWKGPILSGRAKEMPNLDWHSIAKGGGLSLPVPKIEGPSSVSSGDEMRRSTTETEVWGTMSSGECAGGVASFLVVGSGMPDVLGWNPSELVGREVAHLMVDGVHQFNEELHVLRGVEGISSPSPRRFLCKMQHKNGSTVDVVFIMYRSTDRGVSKSNSRDSICGIISAPLIYQIRTLTRTSSSSSFTSFTSSSLTATATTSFAHALDSGVFEELDTTRDSSWQYEIQQVRFANQRLEEEIAGLSKQLEEVGDRRKNMREVVREEEDGSVCEDMANSVLDCYVPSASASTKFAMLHSSGPLHLDFDSSSSSLSSTSERHHRPYATAAVAETRHHDLVPDYAMAAIPSYVSQFSTLSSFSAREWDDSVFLQQQQQQQSRIQGLKRSWDLIHK